MDVCFMLELPFDGPAGAVVGRCGRTGRERRSPAESRLLRGDNNGHERTGRRGRRKHTNDLLICQILTGLPLARSQRNPTPARRVGPQQF
jgi:hypothetical protein